jgi:RHS repeat-associated protein
LNGNRLHLTTPSGTLNGTYDAQDRLTTYGANSYTYGANGELKTKTDATGTTSYNYDALGNLTALTVPDGTQIAYVIDGQNRRVGKKVNGVLVQGFLYQGRRPVAELDGNQQVVSRFVYATRAHIPHYLIKSGITYRLVSDHLGSVRLVVNTSDGTVAQRINYDEFGHVTQNSAPGFQPFGFAGGLLDDQSGLVRFGSRDFDPVTGRWTAKDPIGFAGNYSNLYQYAGGDPINLIDVDGYFPRKPGKTPPTRWPGLPDNLAGKTPRWNPDGYWEGADKGRYTWDDRSHGAGVDRGEGPQGGHWDDERSGDRWDETGDPLSFLDVEGTFCPTPRRLPGLDWLRLPKLGPAETFGLGSLGAGLLILIFAF